MRPLPIALLCTTLALGGCGQSRPSPHPGVTPAGPTAADALLEPADLPDGYTTSPPDATPEVSAASSPSVPGCDALLDYFRDGSPGPGGRLARFDAGGAGPFLAESLSGAQSGLDDLAGRCGDFTDTDDDGVTTKVSVAPVGDFPSLGGDEHVFAMSADGGSGDDAFALSGYLVEVRVGGLTCTLVHFGQPGVDRAETESIARAAVTKIKTRQ